MQLRGYTGFCAIAGLTVSCLAVPVARGAQDPVFRSRATLVPVGRVCQVVEKFRRVIIRL